MKWLRPLMGREALEQFEAKKPDLVILDLMLPELDGLEVAKEIRKTSHTPIIMLSAKDSEFDKVYWIRNWGRRLCD